MRRSMMCIGGLLVLASACAGSPAHPQAVGSAEPTSTSSLAASSAGHVATTKPAPQPTAVRPPQHPVATPQPYLSSPPRRSRPPAPPAPPRPTARPFVPPTVTWSKFVSCHATSGGGHEFRALIDLVGGSAWRPALANMSYVSANRWAYSGSSLGNGGPTSPSDETWKRTELFDTSHSAVRTVTLTFPARWVVRGRCPS